MSLLQIDFKIDSANQNCSGVGAFFFFSRNLTNIFVEKQKVKNRQNTPDEGSHQELLPR